MKTLFALTLLLGISSIAQASASDRGDSKTQNLHPKQRAECLLQSAIASNSNAEIDKQIQQFQAEQLQPSAEISSVFIRGTCDDSINCSYEYLVTTDFYNNKHFKTIKALVRANSQSANLIRVLSQDEVN